MVDESRQGKREKEMVEQGLRVLGRMIARAYLRDRRHAIDLRSHDEVQSPAGEGDEGPSRVPRQEAED